MSDPGDECGCSECNPEATVLTFPVVAGGHTRKELIEMPRDEFEVVVRRRGSQFDYLDDLPPAA